MRKLIVENKLYELCILRIMGELTGGMGVLESGVEYGRVNRGDGSIRIRGRIWES